MEATCCAGVKRLKADDDNDDDSDDWDNDEDQEDSFTSNLLGLGKHPGLQKLSISTLQ